MSQTNDLRRALEEKRKEYQDFYAHGYRHVTIFEIITMIDFLLAVAVTAHSPKPAEGTGLRNKLLRLVYSARTGFDLDAPSIAQPVTDGDIYLVDRILSLGAPAPDGGLRERVAGLASHYQGQADNPESPYYARGIWQTVANNLDAALRAQPPKETKG